MAAVQGPEIPKGASLCPVFSSAPVFTLVPSLQLRLFCAVSFPHESLPTPLYLANAPGGNRRAPKVTTCPGFITSRCSIILYKVYAGEQCTEVTNHLASAPNVKLMFKEVRFLGCIRGHSQSCVGTCGPWANRWTCLLDSGASTELMPRLPGPKLMRAN